MKTYQKSIAGFSMIEMLIAVIVLSVGLIGIAGLQARGQQFNYVSYVRTQASFLAYDIMDRMRLNQKAHSNDNTVDIPSTYFNQVATARSAAASDSMDPNCDQISCSYQQLAQYDLVRWFKALQQGLPDGDAEIKQEGNSLRIIVKWAESRDPSASLKTQEWVYQ